MPLTAKQQRFVEEYLVDLNATQAAIRAGYSKKTARVVGNENLTKPDISAAIQAEIEARSVRTEITQDKVLNDLEELRLLAIQKGQLGVAARCSELQGKHLRLFTDRVEHEGIPASAPVQNEWIIQPVRTLTELEKLKSSEAGKLK